jgi:hypothetical protein
VAHDFEGRRVTVARRFAALVASARLAMSLVGVAGTAGAQTTTTSGFSCSFTVDRTALPAGGGVVTVSGVAPGSSVVRIFVDGVLVATTTSAPVTGTFSVQITITESSEVTAALDGYPTTPCAGVGGESVERPQVATATATRLAFTGSSSTGPIVLVALCAVSLGVVLVVAARRRSRVQGRA